MASTASTLLKIELQATGENASTWGTKANVSLSRLEEAIADITNIAVTGAADYTLDDTQYNEHVDGSNTSESHVAAIKATGTLTANQNIIVPSRNKIYWIWNATSGAFTVTVKTAAGTGIAVTQSGLQAVICDGTNVEALTKAVTTTGALASALTVAEGGTGATSASAALVNLGVDGSSGNIAKGDLDVAAKPYDVAFNAGFDATHTLEDVVVQTYGELVMTRSGSFTGEAGYIDTVATGAAATVDILKNGTTIYTTVPQFAVSTATLTAGTLKTDGSEDFVSGDRITFKVLQIGSTIAGQGVRFTVKGNIT